MRVEEEEAVAVASDEDFVSLLLTAASAPVAAASAVGASFDVSISSDESPSSPYSALLLAGFSSIVGRQAR